MSRLVRGGGRGAGPVAKKALIFHPRRRLGLTKLPRYIFEAFIPPGIPEPDFTKPASKGSTAELTHIRLCVYSAAKNGTRCSTLH